MLDDNIMFAFRRHGGPPIFGYGTHAEAVQFLTRINHNRALNHYVIDEFVPGEVLAVADAILLAIELRRTNRGRR